MIVLSTFWSCRNMLVYRSIFYSCIQRPLETSLSIPGVPPKKQNREFSLPCELKMFYLMMSKNMKFLARKVLKIPCSAFFGGHPDIARVNQPSQHVFVIMTCCRRALYCSLGYMDISTAAYLRCTLKWVEKTCHRGTVVTMSKNLLIWTCATFRSSGKSNYVIIDHVPLSCKFQSKLGLSNI